MAGGRLDAPHPDSRHLLRPVERRSTQNVSSAFILAFPRQPCITAAAAAAAAARWSRSSCQGGNMEEVSGGGEAADGERRPGLIKTQLIL